MPPLEAMASGVPVVSTSVVVVCMQFPAKTLLADPGDIDSCLCRDLSAAR